METNVLLGATKSAIIGDDTYAAVTGSTPSAQWVWHCCATTMDSTASASLVLSGKVEYLVDFYDRNLLGLSSSLEAAELKSRKYNSLPPAKR